MTLQRTGGTRSVAVPPRGDNSYQRLTVGIEGVTRLDLRLVGSGALARIAYCPDAPCADGDGDGVCDTVDNCPTQANADQRDGDADGMGDACDATLCPLVLDFEVDAMGTPLAAGTPVAEQWASMGIRIAADSRTDVATLFDSARPTGNDADLGAPNGDFGGPGMGDGGRRGTAGENRNVLGKILIVAENVTDGNGDGRIDDPDDEAAGGVLQFTFAGPTVVHSVDLLDVDSYEVGGAVLTTTSGGGVAQDFAIPTLGNNSFQRLAVGASNVVDLKVRLVGSGAVARLEYCPQ
jgi:hypothetical protein